MKNKDWVKLRSKLHHDWLQNSFITFLEANQDCLNSTDSVNDEIDDILDQLLEWQNRHSKFLKFIEDAVEALSPRQLLNTPPLSNLCEEDRVWIGDLVHSIYLQKTQINSTIKNLIKAFNKVDSLVNIVVSNLQGEHFAETDKCGEKLLNEIIVLSKQISALPNSIQFNALLE